MRLISHRQLLREESKADFGVGQERRGMKSSDQASSLGLLRNVNSHESANATSARPALAPADVRPAPPATAPWAFIAACAALAFGGLAAYLTLAAQPLDVGQCRAVQADQFDRAVANRPRPSITGPSPSGGTMMLGRSV